MNKQSFTATISVEQSPEVVFKAIGNVRGWWSEEIEGGTSVLNDEFSYHYKDIHRCRMRLVEVVPNKRIVWRVLDNYFQFVTDQSEWLDTTVRFEIAEKDGKTEVHFTHEGLLPEHECYEICSNAWGGYIRDSLRDLITTGVGQPNRKEVEI